MRTLSLVETLLDATSATLPLWNLVVDGAPPEFWTESSERWEGRSGKSDALRFTQQGH